MLLEEVFLFNLPIVLGLIGKKPLRRIALAYQWPTMSHIASCVWIVRYLWVMKQILQSAPIVVIIRELILMNPNLLWALNEVSVVYKFLLTIVVEFFHRAKEYYEFAPTHKHKFDLDGYEWATIDHFYHAQKWKGNSFIESLCRLNPGCRALYCFARKHPHGRSDWDDVKVPITLRALRAKFTQDETLKAKLLKTGNALLVNKFEPFWGTGTGSDENVMGELLMMVRDDIRRGLTKDHPLIVKSFDTHPQISEATYLKWMTGTYQPKPKGYWRYDFEILIL